MSKKINIEQYNPHDPECPEPNSPRTLEAMRILGITYHSISVGLIKNGFWIVIMFFIETSWLSFHQKQWRPVFLIKQSIVDSKNDNHFALLPWWCWLFYSCCPLGVMKTMWCMIITRGAAGHKIMFFFLIFFTRIIAIL